jgi:hypothetical protein
MSKALEQVTVALLELQANFARLELQYKTAQQNLLELSELKNANNELRNKCAELQTKLEATGVQRSFEVFCQKPHETISPRMNSQNNIFSVPPPIPTPPPMPEVEKSTTNKRMVILLRKRLTGGCGKFISDRIKGIKGAAFGFADSISGAKQFTSLRQISKFLGDYPISKIVFTYHDPKTLELIKFG